MEKISWQSSEYFHTEKSTDWYWIVGIVSISLAIIAIIFDNLIFGILIIISTFTLTLLASRKPAVVDVELDNTGVTIGKTKYPYKSLHSFWIESKNFHPRILIKSSKVLMPLLIIFIEEEREEEIKNFLLKNLKEEELSEPLFEKLLIYLGF